MCTTCESAIKTSHGNWIDQERKLKQEQRIRSRGSAPQRAEEKTGGSEDPTREWRSPYAV